MSNKQLPTHRTLDLVVGVDGTPASANALRYAVHHSARVGAKVDVFHVVTDFAPMAYPIPFDDLMQAGRAALDATLRQVGQSGQSTGEDTVETHLGRGGVVKTLTDAGRHAQAIVVGSDRRSTSMRLLTGNVSTGLAARSAVPVVSVPETWQVDSSTGVVLVGVKHPDHADALMPEAFDVARRAGSKLVVLHAWRMASAYDDIIVSDPETLAEWRDRAERELRDLIAPWRVRYPDVDVELRVVHDYSARALVEASEHVDELIIVRRAHGIPAAAHLGSTARTVLLHSHCPVRVVPAVHVPVVPDLEAAGAAQKQSMA